VCHGDQSVSDRVPLNCIDCHDYHRTSESSLLKGAVHATP
jgi:hypothetical protein